MAHHPELPAGTKVLITKAVGGRFHHRQVGKIFEIGEENQGGNLRTFLIVPIPGAERPYTYNVHPDLDESGHYQSGVKSLRFIKSPNGGA